MKSLGTGLYIAIPEIKVDLPYITTTSVDIAVHRAIQVSTLNITGGTAEQEVW